MVGSGSVKKFLRRRQPEDDMRGRMSRLCGPISQMLLPASSADRIVLPKSHLPDNFLKLGTMAERIKAWILRQRKELHIPLVTGTVEPYNHLIRVAERGVCRGDVIGRHALVGGCALEFVQNLAGGRLIARN